MVVVALTRRRSLMVSRMLRLVLVILVFRMKRLELRVFLLPMRVRIRVTLLIRLTGFGACLQVILLRVLSIIMAPIKVARVLVFVFRRLMVIIRILVIIMMRLVYRRVLLLKVILQFKLLILNSLLIHIVRIRMRMLRRLRVIRMIFL